MTHFIDADRLKAEIERRMTENCELAEKAEAFGQRAVEDNDILALIDSLQQKQPEFPNGKFVFPKYLYARTKDNKTLDVSYAPQDMTAIEYVRNDLIEKEQPQVSDASKMGQEVDLEKFDKDVTEIWGRCAAEPNDSIACLHIDTFIEIARHFWNKGYNARKEE